MDLSGKGAIVTGGARGIGYAIAEALLKKGCKVCIVDVLVETGNTAAKELGSKYGSDNVMFVQCDVTKEEELKATFEKAVKTMGRLDIVANNAGIGRENSWKKMIDVNLVGVIYGVHLGFQYMGKDHGGKGGIIINTASETGFQVVPEMPIYSATKHGVVGLSRSYGMPFHYDRTGVAVNALCPTAVDTPILKDNDLPEDVFKGIIERFTVVKPSYIAEGFLKLIEEEKTGAVLFAAADGFHYM